MKESALRDLIAQKISQLKPGLTLLQKEQYIPGEHGTKSFIDLYARDEKGRHVLIELKRSNTAARQALHEVSKYVEQVKQHFGAKDSEIFAIIASTEWGELLLPFSRFCEDAGFSIEKIQIDVTEDHSDCQARPIDVMPWCDEPPPDGCKRRYRAAHRTMASHLLVHGQRCPSKRDCCH